MPPIIDIDADSVPVEEIAPTLIALASLQTRLAARLLAAAPADPAAASAADDRLLTVVETAQRLRRSTKWVYRAVKKGCLPFARRIGGSLVFSEQGLERWLTKQRP